MKVDYPFKLKFSKDIFNYKYRHDGCETWPELARTLSEDVFLYLDSDLKYQTAKAIAEMKFIPGGRYLYYAGRPRKFFNNCFLLKAEEDTREDWARLSWSAENCLMTGGGIGIDYSMYRSAGSLIKSTGGTASGPIPKMQMINEIGRHVMQGGSRRSAIYASLNWQHDDIHEFLHSKDWAAKKVAGTGGLTIADLKAADFNYPAPLDMTNISVNYDTRWANLYLDTGDPGSIFMNNVRQALETGEPGFSFNFYEKEKETLRNAPVSGSTRVLTSHGYRFVKDIVGECVEVWTGSQWAKTSFKKTKSDVETLTVHLSNGRSITCESGHPFITKDYIGKGKDKSVTFERIAAEKLVEGQKIKSDLPQLEKWTGLIKIPYALGFILGDGSISKGTADLSYFVDTKKPCWEICKSVFRYATILENRFYAKLSDVFVSESNKQELMESASCYSPSFIAGWFDADGCWTRGLLRLSCSNIDWLYKLTEALDYYGIQSIIRPDGYSSYKPVNRSYTLHVMAGSLKRFSEIIPTIRLDIDIPDDYVPYRDSEIRVVSVEPSGIIEDVFCCDVGVEEHSFMAEGVLISNCTEVTSKDDSDVCNLGSVNVARIDSLDEFKTVVELGTLFLLYGTLRSELPYSKVYTVRDKNRRLGLGLMGVHEWLLKRNYRYEMNDELRRWLDVYEKVSTATADSWADQLSISRPVAKRAIAPTGSIGNLASTTTGIEPIYAIAYKRRYLRNGNQWHYQYVLDETANHLISEMGLDSEAVETAVDLATDYERRIRFQADVQDYVDMAISSTINLPAWGSIDNHEGIVAEFAHTLAKYAYRLRGFTCYPDGSRGGQPLTAVAYSEAKDLVGEEFVDTPDICEITGKGGVCGV